MRPLIPGKAGYAVKHAQRLDGPDRFDDPQILGLPAELVQHAADHLLGLLVIATYEHGRLAGMVFFAG